MGGSPANRQNPCVDPIVIVIILVIAMPLGVMWALAKSSQLRGPLPRPESRRAVGSLVTEAVPEEHPDESDADTGLGSSVDSDPLDTGRNGASAAD